MTVLALRPSVRDTVEAHKFRTRRPMHLCLGNSAQQRPDFPIGRFGESNKRRLVPRSCKKQPAQQGRKSHRDQRKRFRKGASGATLGKAYLALFATGIRKKKISSLTD